jgi:peptide/nickel transport system ATP-binding protein
VVRVYEPTAGQIVYHDAEGRSVELSKLGRVALRPYRQQIRMVFQDPYSSLNPRMTLLDIVGEPLRVHRLAAGKALEERVAQLLRRAGLRPEYMCRYPHAFSGDERQRVGIARALALSPRLVVADEAVSALDVSVRAQILNLLQDLQSEFGLTYLFIAHDPSAVEYLCDRMAVMYVGKLAEVATIAELFARPRHPYTEALLSAVPKPDPRLRIRGRRIILQGEVANPSNPPRGCASTRVASERAHDPATSTRLGVAPRKSAFARPIRIHAGQDCACPQLSTSPATDHPLRDWKQK